MTLAKQIYIYINECKQCWANVGKYNISYNNMDGVLAITVVAVVVVVDVVVGQHFSS